MDLTGWGCAHAEELKLDIRPGLMIAFEGLSGACHSLSYSPLSHLISQVHIEPDLDTATHRVKSSPSHQEDTRTQGCSVSLREGSATKMWRTPPSGTWAAEARAALDKARTNGDVGTGDPFEVIRPVLMSSKEGAQECCWIRRDGWGRGGGAQVTLNEPTDLIFYSMGDVDLVRMDLEQTLPPPVYEEAMRVLREQGLHAAYDCRRELVNFKKVLPAVVPPPTLERCNPSVVGVGVAARTAELDGLETCKCPRVWSGVPK